MTVYVDKLRSYPQKATSGSRFFGNGKQSCHLATDGELEELHQFAVSIGLKREWFQDHRRVPHYDLTPNKRQRALAKGAQEASSEELIERCKRKEPVSEAED